jgi:hypothetical protein
MSRQTELAPDPNFIEIRLKKNSTGHYVEAPQLLDDWESEIAKFLPKDLSEHQRALRYLKSFIHSYAHERLVRTKSPNLISWNDLLGNLRALSQSSKSLLSELNKRTAFDPTWRRLSVSSGTLTELRSLLSSLSGAAETALSTAEAEKKKGLKRDHKEPWFRFVNELANLFECGLRLGRATATKNSAAKPSLFVEFLWTIMKKAVPRELREHAQSKDAMAKAVSLALRKKSRTDPWPPSAELPTVHLDKAPSE